MRLGQMDLNLLVVLDALLREKNVTRAAERLHMSQPAISSALARLRKTLDDPLLVKSGRHLHLSPRAETLIDPVREVLATVEQSILRPSAFDPMTDTRAFSIVASDYVGVVLLRPLLGRIGELGPHLRLDLSPVGEGFRSALRRDEIDLSVLPERLLDEQTRADCFSTPVIEDRLVGVVWSQHPAAAGGVLTAEVLSSFPYLMYAVGGERGFWEDELDEQSIDRSVEATAATFTTMPLMLAGTRLVAIVPERLARLVARAGDLALLEPGIPLPPMRQSAVWHPRRDTDAGHRWLRERLEEVVASLPAVGSAVDTVPQHL